MENTRPTKYDATNCPDSNWKGHKDWEYDGVGFSPCGEYVAHQSSTPCDVINGLTIIEISKEPHDCTCRTSLCACGTFLSHKVSEPCTAKV
jgi:hypothetical protein